MYLEIEEQFIEQSKLRKSRTFLGFLAIVVLVAAFFCLPNWFFDQYIAALSVIAVVFLILFYAGILIYLKIYKKDFSLKIFWDPFEVVDIYRRFIHEQDIKILKEILKEHNIKSKDNVREVMHHYRALMPKNIKSGSAWLSASAFAVSVVALIFNDEILNSDDYLKIAGMLFVSILMIYWMISFLNSTVIQMFGKPELYKRLESSITEIYLNIPEKEEKVIERKRKLRRYRYDKHSQT